MLARAFDSTSLRVGDLSWLSREHTHRELSLDIRVWEDDAGRLIAWTYFRPNGEFNVFVAPKSGFAEATALHDELLGVIETAGRMSVAAGDPPISLVTYGINVSRSDEERALAAALQRFGYGIDQATSATSGVMTRSLDELPEPSVPNGYHLDWVRTPSQVTGRVEVHRAAFAPSDVSVRKYERLQRTWPYRPTLDRIALTDDGTVVAFCTAWLDEENAAGLLRARWYASRPSAPRSGARGGHRRPHGAPRERRAHGPGWLWKRSGLRHVPVRGLPTRRRGARASQRSRTLAAARQAALRPRRRCLRRRRRDRRRRVAAARRVVAPHGRPWVGLALGSGTRSSQLAVDHLSTDYLARQPGNRAVASHIRQRSGGATRRVHHKAAPAAVHEQLRAIRRPRHRRIVVQDIGDLA